MFNPNVRWDRPLPQESDQNNRETEPVLVVAGFRPARNDLEAVKIRPMYFIRKHQQRKIDKVNYSWSEKKGRKTLYHFSVSAGDNVFYLSLDSEIMSWSLTSN